MILDPAELPAQRILVVAPHPDDESLGCGGLIAALACLGRQFHVLFVTDGGMSHPGSPTWPRTRLAAQRKAEAGRALVELGIGDAPRTFLCLPDAAMPRPGTTQHTEASARVNAILREFEPDLAILPWRRDPHCDHRDSWTLVMERVLRQETPPRLLEYAVWLAEFGAPGDAPEPDEAETVVFDVGTWQEAKRRAIHAHVSQTTDLIADDPTGFRLSPETIERLSGPHEVYFEPLT